MKTSIFSLLTLAGLLTITGCASNDHEQGGSYDPTESSQGQLNSSTNNMDRGGYWFDGNYYRY